MGTCTVCVRENIWKRFRFVFNDKRTNTEQKARLFAQVCSRYDSLCDHVLGLPTLRQEHPQIQEKPCIVVILVSGVMKRQSVPSANAALKAC